MLFLIFLWPFFFPQILSSFYGLRSNKSKEIRGKAMDQKFLLDSRKSRSTVNPYATTMPQCLLHLSLRLVLSLSFYYGVFMWIKTNLPPYMVAKMNARCGCEGILSKICCVSAKILIWNLFVSWKNEGESI